MRRRTFVASSFALSACATAARASENYQVSAARTVTIGVEDLAMPLRLFRGTMGYTAEAADDLSPQRRAFLGIRESVYVRWVELSCAGYQVGRVRLIQHTPRPANHTRDDFGTGAVDSPIAIGPKALDFYTRTTLSEGIGEFANHGLVPRTETPARYPGGLEEVVFTGPGRAPLMQMSRPTTPNGDMRPNMPTDRYSEVATMSVICADLDASRRFYGDLLKFEARFDRLAPEGFRAPVAKLIGSPPELQAHWMIYNAKGENSAKILLIHFTDGPKPKLTNAMSPAHLGIGLYTFSCTDVVALAARANSLGFTVVAKPTRVDGSLSTLIRGPNDELCEFSELSA